MAKPMARKTWYELTAPDMFDNTVLTQTPAEKQDQVVGRTVRVPLNNLMDTRKRYMDVHLKVTRVEGGKAFTEFAGHTTAKEYINRMVRKQSKRIDYNDVVETSDGRRLRVKLIAITLKQAQRGVQTAIQDKLAAEVEAAAANHSLEEFVNMIFTGQLQQQISAAVKPVYPLRSVEFRATEVLE